MESPIQSPSAPSEQGKLPEVPLDRSFRGATTAPSSKGDTQDMVTLFLATCAVLRRVWSTKQLVGLAIHQVLELMSLFAVTYLAQWTSHLFLLAVLIVMYALASYRARSGKTPLLWPIYLLTPERHSVFGLCHQQVSAMSFQLANVTLRLGCVALWMILVLTMPHESICVVPVTEFEEADAGCQAVPSWLQPGCGTYYSASESRSCTAASWFRYGYCNLLAAQCRNQALGPIELLLSVSFSSMMSLVSFVSPGLWLVSALWLSLTGPNVFNTPKASELETSIREEEIELATLCPPSRMEIGRFMRGYMLADFVLTFIDFGSDLFCALVFLFARNWMFAITQLLILSITAAHLIDRRSRGVLSLLTPGIFREGYLELMIVERSRRCPLSLLLQLYAWAFITSNALVVFILSLSLCSSMLSTLLGGFMLVHCDLTTSSWTRV